MDALLADGVAPGADHGDTTSRRATPTPAPFSHTEAAARYYVLLPALPGPTDEQQDFVVERLAHHTAAVVVT